MKKGSGKRKGGAFERLICKKLSLWWSEGKRDDIFFRTASSGGRATQRAKKGKKTFGQYGDIQAADPIGQRLMNNVVIECKDGYASDSIADLLDCEKRHNPKYLQFIEQVRTSTDSMYNYQLVHGKGLNPSWVLIARRRGRQIMVYIPWCFAQVLKRHMAMKPKAKITLSGGDIIFCTPLDQFLTKVSPDEFK